MQSICFIAARAGSKGVPNKNIRKIHGLPLIAYTIKSAKISGLFKHIVVSTDSHEIKRIAIKFGAEVPFIRPKKLSGDNVSIIDVIVHGIKKLRSLSYEFDTIAIRDCTVPFLSIDDMKGSMNLLKRKKCNGVFAVYEQHNNPYFNMVESDKSGFLKISKKPKQEIFSRQNSPAVYQLTGLFVFNVESVLNYKRLLMPKIIPYEIHSLHGFMIDTELEFKVAELIFKEKLLKKI
jgi:CMP-N-acetylneuraminic acid synthetase|tara:strand:+ start:3845 stop:4546 length:702 start_codon:yes stop_codon:yes gene_type:complete